MLDENKIEELIRANIGLVYKQLSRFGLAYDPDATSLGYEALYNAIITYDSSKNYKLSTYATVCIYNRLGSYVRHLKSRERITMVSYDAPVGEDACFLDLLESPDRTDEKVIAKDGGGVDDILTAIRDTLDLFPNDNHRKILNLWIESSFTKTQSVIAEETGFSQPYINQIIKKFKNILRRTLSENYKLY